MLFDMVLLYVGVVMALIGASGIGCLKGLGSEAQKISRWQKFLIYFLLIMGMTIFAFSSFHVNKGEPISTFETGKEYRILESLNYDAKDCLIIDDNSGAPRLYIVDQDKLEGHMPFGRFAVIGSPTGQRIQFF